MNWTIILGLLVAYNLFMGIKDMGKKRNNWIYVKRLASDGTNV